MPNQNPNIEAKLESIKKRFEKRITKIQKNGSERLAKLNDEAPDPSNFEAAINLSFDVKWRMTSIKFDVPQFSMVRETIKFDIPEVRMETEEFSFDVPSTRMEVKCILKKPEFYGFPPKIKWTCITKTKVPVPYMKRITFKTDIPKFNSKRVEWKFDKPVVEMETTEIKLHLPQFFLKEVDAQIDAHSKDVEEVANDMTSELAKVESEMKTTIEYELAGEIDLLFDEMRASILVERENICKSYDDAIAKTKSAIKILKANNATAEVTKLEQQLSKIVTDYQNVLSELDSAIEEMNKQEGEILQNLRVA